MPGRVQRLAQVEVEAVVGAVFLVDRGAVLEAPLVTGPAEVAHRRRERIRHAVDLLPAGDALSAGLAHVDVVRARPDRHPEGVAQAVPDDPARVRVRAGEVGIAGRRRPGVGVDADQRAVQAGRVPGRAHVLGAQPPALGGRRAHRPTHAARRVATGVQGLALLAVVGEVPRGPVAAGVVQVAVGAELEPPADVARVLEAARHRHQHLLGAAGDLARDLEARDATADHAPVLVSSGPVRRVRASVGGLAGDAPRRRRAAGRGVVRVEEVDVRVGGEIRVHGKAEQPPVPVVVDLGPQVGDLCRRRVGGVLVRLHDAALLRHEHAPVGCELDRRRRVEPGEGNRLLETGRERHGPGRRSKARQMARHSKVAAQPSSARTASAGAPVRSSRNPSRDKCPPGRTSLAWRNDRQRIQRR